MIFSKSNIPQNLNKFIVIDGINGAGKTTLIKNLKNYFQDKNLPILTGKEPGGTHVGDELRKIVLSTSNNLTAESQFFIMSASRAEYVNKVVQPAIDNNTFFISDRYYYSSLAFQSYAGGLDFEFVYNVSKVAIKGCVPSITFILDLDLETAFNRLNIRNKNSNEVDNFENEKIEYHKKVRNGFLDLTKKLPENFCIIDASKDEKYIFDCAVNVINEIYNL